MDGQDTVKEGDIMATGVDIPFSKKVVFSSKGSIAGAWWDGCLGSSRLKRQATLVYGSSKTSPMKIFERSRNQRKDGKDLANLPAGPFGQTLKLHAERGAARTRVGSLVGGSIFGARTSAACELHGQAVALEVRTIYRV